MRTVRVQEAVGAVLCHDITKIVPGEYKGPLFKKGHIITADDIPELLKIGKEHVYVWQLEPGMVHEDEAAIRIARALGGRGLSLSEPREGKVSLSAADDGLLIINEKLLLEINQIDEIIVATRSNYRPVKAGDAVAGTRVIPLVIEESKLKAAETLGQEAEVIAVKPFNPLTVGIVTVGNEIYHGRIEDKFGPVVAAKTEAYGCRIVGRQTVPDQVDLIKEAVLHLIASGAQMVLTTGGMSVDPDDVTPQGIRTTGARVVTYGIPVLPGAMLMVAYLGDVAVLGLPGCVMYNKITAFDWLLPLVLAGEPITKPLITRLGLGGLCLNCPTCHYPNCGLGTGA